MIFDEEIQRKAGYQANKKTKQKPVSKVLFDKQQGVCAQTEYDVFTLIKFT